ncbi:hypothetical protein HZB69_00870 [Candidatus Amesbacteria bacterium]|nr:hypothetical protein [Candidatus Amesbacteria bacterium]MBI5412535.1 hypothetical protein [Candidatus Peregrinibacteria bacterium]
MKKKIKSSRTGLVFAIFILFIGGIFGIIWINSYSMISASEKWFSLVKENKLQEAYEEASKEFQKGTSFDQFSTLIKKIGISDYKTINWGSRTRSGNSAVALGIVIFPENKTLPMEVRLIKEEGAWKLLGINLKTDNPIRTPDEKEIQGLAQKAIKLFVEAVQTKDFSNLYGSIADQWKAQIDATALATAFKSFIDKKMNLSFVKTASVEFTEAPAIDEKGVLKLVGHSASKKQDLLFQLEYAYEAPAWKLVRINVQAK